MTTIENLIAIRKSQKVTQDEIAARIDVSKNTVSNWEQGKFHPSLKDAEAYADALGFKIVLQIKS